MKGVEVTRVQGLNISRETKASSYYCGIDKEPLYGSLKDHSSLAIKVASRKELEPLWDHLVRSYHYLGYQKLLGHSLKYLVFHQDRPIAALSFSAAALKVRVRDSFIGWTDEQRKENLKRIINNSRFLVLPWISIKNLASHILSCTVKQMIEDWRERYDVTPWLLETYVDPMKFKGTCYRAANWKYIGNTGGFGKLTPGYVYHGNMKEVYVYVIEKGFRTYIGCMQKPYDFIYRPASSKKMEGLEMVLREAGWKPTTEPDIEFTEEEVSELADNLIEFHEQFHSCYGRSEHHRLGLAYISGLISDIKDKSIEPIALEILDKRSVRSLQLFMKHYHWDHEEMEDRHQRMLARRISCKGAMLNVDSSEFLKKGKESVGVSRQYCGAVGKVDNCQSGVFVGYSSKKGYGLLTSRLYMPEVWFSDEYKKRRIETLVPEALEFKTKIEIASELIQEVIAKEYFEYSWIGVDATFGSDMEFLNSLPQSTPYFASIRSNEKVFIEKPSVGIPEYKGKGRHPEQEKVLSNIKPQTVAEVAKGCSFRPTVIAEGAKGPIIAEVTRVRVYPSRKGLPLELPIWLFIRKTSDGETKYAFSNAPEDVAFEEMIKASVMRWPIEQCFQEGKGHVGMDHYEHRSWPAWHRHMIFVFLGLHFLLQLRTDLKKTLSDSTSGEKIGISGITPSLTYKRRSNRNCEVSYTSQLCCLYIP